VSTERADRGDHFVLFRKTPGGVLGVHLFSVGDNVEDAAAALDELDVSAELLLQLRLQPGGAGKIVSTDAVCDGDFHAYSFYWRILTDPSSRS
jgi:hypothetical protein